MANTEMSIYQISRKIEQFCNNNNLKIYKQDMDIFFIYFKTTKNNFKVELEHSIPSNIIKIFYEKNIDKKLKDLLTKFFSEFLTDD